MAKVVQTLIDFGHVQKLAARIRLHRGAHKSRGLRSWPRSQREGTYWPKLARGAEDHDKAYPVIVSRAGRDIWKAWTELSILPSSSDSLSTQRRLRLYHSSTSAKRLIRHPKRRCTYSGSDRGTERMNARRKMFCCRLDYKNSSLHRALSITLTTQSGPICKLI
jgi:hypothetical protein